MNTFDQVPVWYLIVGIIWSTYQGFRGAVENRFNYETQLANQNESKGQNSSQGNQKNAKKVWKCWGKWVILYIHDFAFRFICTIAGFVALFLVYHMTIGNNCHPETISEVLIAFLSIIGIIGVGGQLHYVILLGKLPKY